MTEWVNHREIFGATIAKRWVAIYTGGLPDGARERRVEQIESDVWEHQQERLQEGQPESQTGLEILGRTVRGMAADVLWRFQLEGPKVQIHIPFERILGGLLLALIVLLIVSTGINGYDTGREGWDGELRRLGGQSDGQIRGNIAIQLFAGMLLIGAAVGFATALHERARTLSLLAAGFLAMAGVRVRGASAAYHATADLAQDFAAGRSGEEVLIPARSVALIMGSLVTSASMALMLGLFTLAVVVHRSALVPRWMAVFAGISFVCAIGSGFSAAFLGDDTSVWLLAMAMLLSAAVWMLLAGLTLLLGRRGSVKAAPALSPA